MSAVCDPYIGYSAFTTDRYKTLQLSSFSVMIFHSETLIAQSLSFMFINSSVKSQLS